MSQNQIPDNPSNSVEKPVGNEEPIQQQQNPEVVAVPVNQQENVDQADNVNKEEEENKDSPEVVEFLQVANHRRENQKMGNKQEFLKIYQQINEKQAQLQQQAKMLQKKKSMKKKTSQFPSNKQIKNHNQSSKKQTILKAIQPVLNRYKITHSPNHSDTEVAKLRYESKQKIFKSILYLAEQINRRDQSKLSQQQQKLQKMQKQELIKLAKTISIQIQVQFLNRLNAGNKQYPSKKYKSHIRNLTTNLLDEANYELRKKIATRLWDAKRLVNAEEMDFYSDEKREQIIQKNKILMNEATIEDKHVGVVQEQQNITYSDKVSWHKKSSHVEQEKVKPQKPQYKHLEEGSLVLIRNLISKEQVYKMGRLLEQDLKGQAKTKLIHSLKTVFSNLY